MIFVSIPSIMIVVGGSTAAILIKFSLEHFINSIKVAYYAIRFKAVTSAELILVANMLADINRKKGIHALDGYKTPDPLPHPGRADAGRRLHTGSPQQGTGTFSH